MRPSSLLIVSCLFFLASYLFNIVVYQQPADNSAKMTEKRALLPDNVVPSFYTLVLTPDFSDFHFMGSIAIDVKVKEATKSIVCHANQLEIDAAASIVEGNGKKIAVKEISLQEKEQTVTFSLEEELEADTEWTLKTTFKGKLNDQMVGFYRSKYEHNGEEKWMATTQFEPTDARMAFPCWDEPAKKAIFSVTLNVPKDKVALSNTHVIAETEVGDRKIVKFANTPIVSTYLICFIVGDFEFVEGKTKEGVDIRVYTALDKTDQGTFALDVAIKTLSYYSEYFDIAYPLKKLDMVAIPDFSAGAMENWGLVTYRETALLCNPKSSGVATRQRVAYVVAHELAHQWFGNLVTMEWWKELWLNEGFATFVGNQAVDFLYPNWDIWTDFNSKYFAAALDLDSLLSSHPIEVEVFSSAEINEIFDRISYCKGASLNRMVHTYLGEETFQKGLQVYLKRHQYGNAKTEDLWAALGEVSKRDVSSFMSVWTKKTGYPVISVSQGNAPNKFNLAQKRFLSSGEPAPEDVLWWNALNILSSNGEMETVELKDASATVEVKDSLVKDANWLKVNAMQSTFCRVKYDDALLEKLGKGILSMELKAIERMGVQNDAFALAQAGMLKTSQALALARQYANETEYPVWSDLFGSISSVMRVWETEPGFPKLQAYVRQLLKSTYERLGWEKNEGESDLDTLLRSTVIGSLGSAKDADVIAEARKRFDALRAGDDTALPADLRYSAYKMAVQNGGVAEWEAVQDIYKTADMSEERIRALRALGATKDKDLMKRTLDFSLSEDVRGQDTFYGTASVSMNSAEGLEFGWTYLKENWEALGKKFEGGSQGFLFARIISYATSGFTSEEKAAEIEQFFKDNEAPFADRTIKQSLETIRLNAKWLQRDREDVAKFLESV